MSEEKKKLNYIQEVTFAIESSEYLDIKDLAKALSENKLKIDGAYVPINGKNGIIVLKE